MADNRKMTPQEKFDAGLARTTSTSCQTQTQSHLVHTKHGTVRVTESVPVNR